MPMKHTYQSAVADDPAADIKPSHWNAEHVVDTGGLLMDVATSAPTAPSTGDLLLYAQKVGPVPLPAYVNDLGVSAPLQPFLGTRRVGMWIAGGSNAAPQALGITPPLTTGSYSSASTSTSNMLLATRKCAIGSVATAGSTASLRVGVNTLVRGTTAGMGGFLLIARFGCGDDATVADARSFVGVLSNTGAIGNVDPSTSTNIIGVGSDSGDSNLSIIHNDSSGVATKIPLGSSFPDHSLSTDLYELLLYAAPADTSVFYRVVRLNTGDTAEGTITTDLPAQTQFLNFQQWRNNGTTALAVKSLFVNLYIESTT